MVCLQEHDLIGALLYLHPLVALTILSQQLRQYVDHLRCECRHVSPLHMEPKSMFRMNVSAYGAMKLHHGTSLCVYGAMKHHHGTSLKTCLSKDPCESGGFGCGFF